jgi:hypothetical protein
VARGGSRGEASWPGSACVLGRITAARGYLTPVQGALIQEVIDVAGILDALRPLRIRPGGLARTPLPA